VRLGKCRASRGSSYRYAILYLECYQNCLKSWKQSVVIQCDQATHPLFRSITGACTLMIKHSAFSVVAELIAEILFMLLSIYNTVGWAENKWIWSVLANGFSANYYLGMHKSNFLIIILSKQSIGIILKKSKVITYMYIPADIPMGIVVFFSKCLL